MSKKLFLSASLLVLLIALGFHGGDRFPPVDGIPAVRPLVPIGQHGLLELVSVEEEDPSTARILLTAVNWLGTWGSGLAYAALVVSALQSLASSLPARSSGPSLFARRLLRGIVAPRRDERSHRRAMARLRPPVPDVVELTLLLSFFPLYIVSLKVGSTLLLLLLAIPLWHRLVRPCVALQEDTPERGPREPQDPTAEDGWARAGLRLLRGFSRDVLHAVTKAAPWWLLVGLLAGVMLSLLPVEGPLESLVPSRGRARKVLVLVSLGLVGAVLPVPRKVPVALTALLSAAGLPAAHAMALLCTLGTSRLGSGRAMVKARSWQTAAFLLVAIVATGVISGVAAHRYTRWDEARRGERLLASLRETPRIRVEPPRLPSGRAFGDLAPRLRTQALAARDAGIEPPVGLEVSRVELRERVGGSGARFRKHEGSSFGIDLPYRVSAELFVEPFNMFRGIAAGDVHLDGWPDVLLTTPTGPLLFANLGGRFVRQEIEAPEISDSYGVHAALVDLDDDGWLDVFFSTYGNGAYVVFNEAGDFGGSRTLRLPNHGEAVMAGTSAFGDLDRDGDLDLVLGNWSVGVLGQVPSPRAPLASRNVMLKQTPVGFETEELAGLPGETLSTLLSDIDLDGRLDLIVGNDFEAPDEYYLAAGDTGFRRLRKSDGVIPLSTWSTMSIASADFDNDLVPEIYLGQITGDIRYFAEFIPSKRACAELTPAYRADCSHVSSLHRANVTRLHGKDPLGCLTLGRVQHRQECLGGMILLDASRQLREDRELTACQALGDWPPYSDFCREMGRPRSQPGPEEDNESIPQTEKHNVFLTRTEDGRFVDRAAEMGISEAGWTWNTRFADLDLDGWQDLFVVGGIYEITKSWSGRNYYFHNDRGTGFLNRTDEFGLSSERKTGSFTYVDFDNDGDIDIIALPLNGPLWFFENQSSEGHSIAFELRDRVGNRYGIGSKVIIHYGPDQRHHQMRELVASGGFASFDPLVAHFGLGGFDGVRKVEIHWSTGERSQIEGRFQAGYRYEIERQSIE